MNKPSPHPQRPGASAPEPPRLADASRTFALAAERSPTPTVVTRRQGASDILVFANDAFLRLLGTTRDDILGRPLSALVASEDDGPALAGAPADDFGCRVAEAPLRGCDGDRLWVNLTAVPVAGTPGAPRQHVVTFQDISRLKRLEARLGRLDREFERRLQHRTQGLEATRRRLQAEVERRQGLEGVLRDALVEKQEMLRQRDFLLKEAHHRTKNTLQLATSILRTQERRAGPDGRPELQAAGQRLARLAEIHDMLDASDAVQAIDFAAYLERLCRDLLGTLEAPEPVDLDLDIDMDAAVWGPDLVVPLALIVNESLTNAVRHAFPGARSGTIRVAFYRDADGRVHLVVGDDGGGRPVPEDEGPLELKIVRALAEQIGAQASIRRGDAGLRVEVVLADVERPGGEGR